MEVGPGRVREGRMLRIKGTNQNLAYRKRIFTKSISYKLLQRDGIIVWNGKCKNNKMTKTNVVFKVVLPVEGISDSGRKGVAYLVTYLVPVLVLHDVRAGTM